MQNLRMPSLASRLLVPALLVSAAFLARAAGAGDPPPTPVPDPAPAPDAPPDEPESHAAPLDAQIAAAIQKGIGYLRTQQKSGGSWGEINSKNPTYVGKGTGYTHPAGPTAMALYAMLKCGVPASDPAVKSGFAALKKIPITPSTSGYELSASLLAVTAVADPFKKVKDERAAGARVRLTGEFRDWATVLQAALVARRGPKGWRYGLNSVDPGGKEDVSSTQLAVLALSAADRCGVMTDPSVYADVATFVLTLQEPSGPETERAVRARKKPRATAKAPDEGYAKPKDTPDVPPKDHARGFHYSIHPTTLEHDKGITGARTASGVGTLALARWALDGPEARGLKKGSRPSSAAIEQAMYDGLAWLAYNWSPWAHENNRNIYYLYCVERAMDLTGAERLGEHLWYLEMVERLLPEQNPEKGFWDTKDGQTGDKSAVIDTSLALLFLRRAAKNGVPVPIVTGGDDAPPTDNR